MILTGKILARIVVVLILGVILQLSFFSQVALFHVSPDMLPALVACFGLLGGTMSGAVTGFSVGLLLDCLLIAPLGGGSLVLLATGYLAGAYRERFGYPRGPAAPLICAGLTLFAELGFGAVQAMLGEVGSNVSSMVLKDILFQVIFAFFLSWPLYIGLRRLLRPALVEAPRPGRRPTVMESLRG
ncbi:MAG: rod shape-determining protein MreD [Actinobacteria bacterium]|nr:rod shape-determining protein MreD [Actinomycetota bacterium]